MKRLAAIWSWLRWLLEPEPEDDVPDDPLATMTDQALIQAVLTQDRQHHAAYFDTAYLEVSPSVKDQMLARFDAPAPDATLRLFHGLPITFHGLPIMVNPSMPPGTWALRCLGAPGRWPDLADTERYPFLLADHGDAECPKT